MIDTNELRPAVKAIGLNGISTQEVLELLDRLEAAEKETASWKGLAKQFGNEADALRTRIAEMEEQEPVAWLHDDGRFVWRETAPHEINYADWKMAFYALPGAQTEPSVPREAIEKMLTQLMDIAVSNGANSVSMPDEYVEVAAWLCGIPAQPVSNIPEGWKLVPIEPTPSMAASIELSTANSVSEIYRAALAAAPEAKP